MKHFQMTFAKDNAAADGFNLWTINGVHTLSNTMAPASFHLKQGRRYPHPDAEPERRHSSDSSA
jgi:hypothetical protein